MRKTQQSYISQVRLKGYKSILELEIDFKSGINIIIGPNGSGKTSFMEALFMARRHYFMENSIFSEIHVVDSEGSSVVYEWHSQKSDEKGVKYIYSNKETRDGNLVLSTKWRVYEDKNRFEAPFEQIGDILKSSSLWDVPQLISYGLPEPFANSIIEPVKIVFNIWKGKIGLLNDKEIEKVPFLWGNIFLKNQHKLYDTDIEESVIDKMDIGMLNDNLNSYSPIEKIRFDRKRVLQYVDETTNTLVLENLILQFFVANKWLYWNQLSDGTKRLFFLISIITYYEKYVLIEEPELGIHPDQLYKLMDFLKNQSEKKQIILTTHSPDVLNILERDQLDRIIVTRYDPEKGTQMHHLSEKQIRKAHIYIDETGDLSDFWVHSNLEEYEEAATK